MVVMDPDQWHILVKFHMAYGIWEHFQEEEENEKKVEEEERRDAIKNNGENLWVFFQCSSQCSHCGFGKGQVDCPAHLINNMHIW